MGRFTGAVKGDDATTIEIFFDINARDLKATQIPGLQGDLSGREVAKVFQRRVRRDMARALGVSSKRFRCAWPRGSTPVSMLVDVLPGEIRVFVFLLSWRDCICYRASQYQGKACRFAPKSSESRISTRQAWICRILAEDNLIRLVYALSSKAMRGWRDADVS